MSLGKKDLINGNVELRGTCNCGQMCAVTCGCTCKTFKLKLIRRSGVSNVKFPATNLRQRGQCLVIKIFKTD